MKRMLSCLRLAADLAAFAALPFVALPALSAETHITVGRTGTLRLPHEPQTLTVVRPGGHGWFIARGATGEPVRVSLPPKFGWVQREGRMVPTLALRAGDRVEVWGLPGHGSLQAARVRVMTERETADRGLRLASAGCCAACATCTECASACAGCKSRAECQSCCGANCCPTAACCA
jgi:hypothetical protein